MDMSDTPETDHCISERRRIHNLNGFVVLELVNANLARKLERERNEARDVVKILCDGKPERPIYFQTDIDEWMERHALAVQECERLECELDKAHKEFLIANDKMVNAGCKAREISSVMERLRKERDKARDKYDNLATENMLQINKLCNERDDAIAERDIARLAALDSDRAHDRMVGELDRVYKKLDDALKALEAK